MQRKVTCNGVLLIVLVSFVLSLIGCDNTLDPLDEEKGLYSIYGALNIYSDTNFVRIRNINIPLDSDTTGTLNAQVELKETKSGNSEILQDYEVEFDGVKTHNFLITLNIKPESNYRILVNNTGGRVVSAMAKTPAISNLTITPEEIFCGSPIRIQFDKVRANEGVRIDVSFEVNGNTIIKNNIVALVDEEQGEARFFTSAKRLIEDNTRLESEDFPPPESICDVLTSNTFEITYRHFGQGFLDLATSDSLNIPGGAANLIGFYEDIASFTINHVPFNE